MESRETSRNTSVWQENNRGEYKLHEHFFCVDASEISSNVSLVPRGAWGVGKKVRVEWWKVDKEKAHFPRPIVPRFITFSFLQILLFHFVETFLVERVKKRSGTKELNRTAYLYNAKRTGETCSKRNSTLMASYFGARSKEQGAWHNCGGTNRRKPGTAL